MLSFNKCIEWYKHQIIRIPKGVLTKLFFLLPLRVYPSPPLTWKVYYHHWVLDGKMTSSENIQAL